MQCVSYPDDNCAAAFPDAGFGAPKDPQVIFSDYLNHTSGISIIAPYLNSSAIAQQSGLCYSDVTSPILC